MVEAGTAQGCLPGLACGDALGRPVEFKSAAAIEARHGTVDEMLGHGTHGQPPGTITDDTELALRIDRSLVSTGGFDGADVAARFVSWYETGPFDIGLLTADALERLQAGEQWDRAGRTVWTPRPEGRTAENGSVLRCAPYALAFTSDERHLGQVSEQSSAITHADPRCNRGCAILTLTIAAFLRGERTPLARALDATYPGQSTAQELATAVDGLSNRIPATEIQNGGYVVDALQADLYYALDAETAEEAIVRAVNASGGTDTVGAITGAVAGARFGDDALPQEWLDAIDESDELRQLAQDLTEVSVPDGETG